MLIKYIVLSLRVDKQSFDKFIKEKDMLYNNSTVVKIILIFLTY